MFNERPSGQNNSRSGTFKGVTRSNSSPELLLPRAQRESRSLPEFPCERRSGPAEPGPGTPKLSERPEGKVPPSPGRSKVESHCPDLFSVSENGSQFRSNRGLGRGQKRFDQDTPAANGHRREALEPVTRWHLGIGVEPTRQRLEGIGVDAALVDPLEQMPQKRSWDVFALDFRHQEPA